MKVLVIGAAGQVATALRRHSPADWRMTALGRPVLDLAHPAAPAVLGRHMDGEADEDTEKSPADLVINAAAYTAVDRAETEERAARRINAEAPAALAQAAAARGIPVLHISSDYVYDGRGSRPFAPGDPPGPLNAYGRSKLAGDLGVAAAGGAYAVLRTSWVFSARGRNFVTAMLRLGAERKSLPVVADQIGGPTAADDIARALIAMGRAFHGGRGISGIYHFAGAPDVSWAGFAREIFVQSRLACRVDEIPTSAYPTPARRPANSRLDCTGLEAAFGIPRPNWRASLAAVLAEREECCV